MKTLKDIMSDWKDDTGLKSWDETTAFHADEDYLYIITKHPGFFIGFHGGLVDKYRSILYENGYDYVIHFVDVSYGNIREF